MKTLPGARAAGQQRVLLCGLIAALAATVLGVYRPAALARLDFRAYDTILGWSPATSPSGRVVIVDVDERSLSEMGQWPWRRDRVGRLVSSLRDCGAAVIALDVVFADIDRNSQSARTPDVDAFDGHAVENATTSPDATFAGILREGRVVIGYGFTFESPANRTSSCVLHPLGLAVVRPPGESISSPLFRASGALCNLPTLAEAAGASGFLNAAPDVDGVLRRVPLLIEFDNRVYPALTLAAVLLHSGTRQVALRMGDANAASLLVGSQLVPLDGKGNLLLNFRGKKNTFPRISAADVLSGRLARDAFKDKLVLVGATALGTRDVVTTPLDTLFTGVELQATVADNLLRQDFISRPGTAPVIESLVTLGVGMVMAFVLARTGPGWGIPVLVACVTGLWAIAQWLLTAKHIFLSPVIPTVGCLAQFGVMTLAGFARERRRANRATVERDVAQRMMIQSLLSLAEMRDADTGRHSRRTQHYARKLAEQLSAHPRFRDYLTPERIDLIASLAPLHDIGKVGIPDQVLNKPGKLTRDEREAMQQHPTYGREVIIKTEQQVGVHDDDVLTMAKDIVYTHHEWWDGHGYPRGLQGEQIPIPGRVVTLVDVYDALTSKRVYRQPMLHNSAVDVIVEGRGTHFDPAVVDAFLQVAPAFESMSAENLIVDARSAAL